MDIHQNARLTPYSREQLARKVICAGCTLKLAAASFNVSAKTAGKWVRRYQAEGLAGLRDRSSRPHRSPRRLPETLRLSVIELRRVTCRGIRLLVAAV